MSMIQGVSINKIEPSDHYRRFIVLKILLDKLYRKQSQFNREGRPSQYEPVLEELQKIEQQVALKNNNNHKKVYDAFLRVGELNSKLEQMIHKVQDKRNSFEGELLKKWRNTLNVKKQNQEQNQKQKEQKSVSNKNLMYLSAELLKKERLSNQNLVNHREKMHRIQIKIANMITQSSKQLAQKHKQLKHLMNKQTDKINQLTEAYRQSLETEKDNISVEIEQTKSVLIQKIKEQKQESRLNSMAIKQLILSMHMYGRRQSLQK